MNLSVFQELPGCSQKSFSRSNLFESESSPIATETKDIRPNQNLAASVENRNVFTPNFDEKIHQSRRNKNSEDSKVENVKRSKVIVPQQNQDMPDIFVAKESNNPQSLSKTGGKKSYSAQLNDGNNSETIDKPEIMSTNCNHEYIAATLKTATKRSRCESQSHIPKKKIRSGNKSKSSSSQAVRINHNSVTLENEHQSSSLFSPKKTRLYHSKTSSSNPNSLKYIKTPVIEIDRNNQRQTVASDNGDKSQSVKDESRGRTIQMISALPLKTKLPRIPKIRQHIAEDHVMTQPLTQYFG